MNRDMLEGRWEQAKVDVKARWARLSDDELKVISAHKDTIVGKLEEHYGLRKGDAEALVDAWLSRQGPLPRH